MIDKSPFIWFSKSIPMHLDHDGALCTELTVADNLPTLLMLCQGNEGLKVSLGNTREIAWPDLAAGCKIPVEHH